MRHAIAPASDELMAEEEICDRLFQIKHHPEKAIAQPTRSEGFGPGFVQLECRASLLNLLQAVAQSVNRFDKIFRSTDYP